MLTKEQLEEARRYFEEQRKAEREAYKAKVAFAQSMKAKMTTEEKIKFVNTPYKDMPEQLQVGMTQWPQVFNYMRMKHPRIGVQQETLAARLIKFRDDHGMDREEFANLCNVYAKKFDTKAQSGRKRQRTRITGKDLTNYEDFNICPKMDKLTVMCRAMGISEAYFTGYGPNEPPFTSPAAASCSPYGGPSSKEAIRSRYRKRHSNAA